MKKIYVADDDADILEILCLMLKRKGYKVDISTDANTVFDYKEDFPDLILLDIWMSGVDGRDISNRLKQDVLLKDVPVIFISANSRLEEISKEYHAKGFLAKPFEMENLLAIVSNSLAGTIAN